MKKIHAIALISYQDSVVRYQGEKEKKFKVPCSPFKVLREGIRIQLSGIRGKSKKSSKFLVHRFEGRYQDSVVRYQGEKQKIG